MGNERVEKNVHDFWLKTCGFDTHRRGSTFGQLDTPWNAFDADNVLVCTLWVDQIVDVFDPKENRTRRFVRIGGRRNAWRGPAIKHGEEADKNLRLASEKKQRVVGFEAVPDPRALLSNERRVSHFYLERVHGLKRVFDFSDHEMLTRLDLESAFEEQVNRKRSDETSPSYLFELIDSAKDFREGLRQDMLPGTESTDSSESEELLFAEDEKSITEQYAIKAVAILISHVLQQKDDVLRPLTYLQLAERLERRNKNGSYWARGLGHVLGRVTTMLESVQAMIPEGIPYLTTIVVSSTGSGKGLPDVGVKHRWPEYTEYSRSEKEAKVFTEYVRILKFGRHWNEVLQHLGHPQIALLPDPDESIRNGGGGWGGGESKEHKALKFFVKANPQLVGATASFRASEEYALRSGDEIDVFFKSEDYWIGVEVKSSISDGLLRDYERGVYQVVKYRAVLEAQARIDHPTNTPSVAVFLVLENQLPKQFRSIAESFGVLIKENIKPA